MLTCRGQLLPTEDRLNGNKAKKQSVSQIVQRKPLPATADTRETN